MPTSEKHTQLEPEKGPSFTPWQRMSRQANYRQLREAERIKERWKRLPFFASAGLIEVGFIRKTQHNNGGQKNRQVPAFNSGMVTQLTFPDDLSSKRFKDLKDLFVSSQKSGDIGIYLNYILDTNPDLQSVQQAAEFLRRILSEGPDQLELNFSDAAFRQQLHHFLVVIYRRCHYRGVLNSLLYEYFYPAAPGASPASMVLFDTFKDKASDPLPLFVPLGDSGKMFKGIELLEQEGFRPEKPLNQEEKNWPELEDLIRRTHQQLWKILEIPDPDEDRLALAIPVYDHWAEGRPFGTYLGHFLLVLDRQKILRQKEKLRDLSPAKRKQFWNELKNQSIWEKLPVHDPSKKLPYLQWEAMERDLNLFAQVVYETEMADWVDYRFDGDISGDSIQQALETAIVRSDGWSVAPAEVREQINESDGSAEEGPPKNFPEEAGYEDFFTLQPLSAGSSISVVWLKLHEGMLYPGDQPRRSLELCLVNDPDTRLPYDEKEGRPYQKLVEQLLRKLYKRYNDFYQRLLRRVDLLATGERRGSEDMILTVTRTIIHEINGDLNQLRTASGYQDLIRALEVWNGYLKFGRTESMGNGVEDFERALTQAKRNAEGIDSLLSMAHFKMKGFYRCIVNEPGKDEKSTKVTLSNLIQTAWVLVLSKPEQYLHFENTDHPSWDSLFQALEGDLEFAFSVLFRNASQHRKTEKTIVYVSVDMSTDDELLLSWTNQTTSQKLQLLEAYLKGCGSRRHSGVSFAASMVKSKFSSELAYKTDRENASVTTSLRIRRNTPKSSSIFLDLVD